MSVTSIWCDLGLSCVSCRKPCVPAEGGLECPACRERYPVEEGILYLGPTSPGHDRAAGLIDSVRKNGWAESLGQRLRGGAPRSIAWRIIDGLRKDRTADWRFLSGWDPHRRMLAMVDTWGAFSIPLAKEGLEVVAADADIEMLAFIRGRAEEEGVGAKIHLLHHPNLLDLPLLPGSFGGLAMGTGSAALDGDRRLVSRLANAQILESAAVLLESRAPVIACLRNRNPLALILDKWARTGGGRSGKLAQVPDASITLSELRSLIRRCGFSGPRIFYAYPEPAAVHCYIPIVDRSAWRFFFDTQREERGWAFETAIRLAVRLGVMSHLAPNYFLLAYKG